MSTKFKVDLTGANVELNGNNIIVKGKEGELHTEIVHPFLKVEKKDNTLFMKNSCPCSGLAYKLLFLYYSL